MSVCDDFGSFLALLGKGRTRIDVHFISLLGRPNPWKRKEKRFKKQGYPRRREKNKEINTRKKERKDNVKNSCFLLLGLWALWASGRIRPIHAHKSRVSRHFWALSYLVAPCG